MTQFFVLLLGFLLSFNSYAQQTPNVAAASSLQFVLPEIVAAFQRESGRLVRITYGSSGNLGRQIAQGAPFELFLSADAFYVENLVEKGFTIDSAQVYALGSIAVIVAKSSNIKLSENLSEIGMAMEQGKLTHFAIANPEHAPYGRAAREALQSYGLWESLQARLLRGENASQATQFAVSGASAGGIVPYTLALSPVISRGSDVMLIPQSRHQPIRQYMVLLTDAGEVAHQFFEFLGGAESQAIFRRNGYEIPDR